MSTEATSSDSRVHIPRQRGSVPARRASRVPRKRSLLPYATLLVDAASLAVAVTGAAIARQHLDLFPKVADDFGSLAAGPVMVLGWLIVIAVSGGYDVKVTDAGIDEYKRVVNASLITAAATGIACYLLRFALPRGLFVLAYVIGIPALVIGRYVLRRCVQRVRQRGALLHQVVIAGAEGHVDEIASVLQRETWLGYQIVGAVVPGLTGRSTTHSGLPLLETSSSIAQAAVAAEADVLFLAGGAFGSANDMRRLAWDLEHEDVQVVLAPSVTDVSRERVRVRPVGGLPLIHLEKPRAADASRRAKRIFDIVGSTCLLLAFAPVMACAALTVWWHDRGPVFFRQVRVGRDGVSFRVWKFRTMATNAEELLMELHKQQGYETGLFKMQYDPRVTTPGRWLRRFSLDELPQLFNVVRGDMSLVGPRPPLTHEVAQYDADMHRRLQVRPGMTGLWQISGRSELSWTEAIRLDLYYVDNWSMIQDLFILARTFGAVFGTRGAY
jgi:exopolysaccharide biosynthesis polyprenyl glycosylphosphotransferase